MWSLASAILDGAQKPNDRQGDTFGNCLPERSRLVWPSEHLVERSGTECQSGESRHSKDVPGKPFHACHPTAQEKPGQILTGHDHPTSGLVGTIYANIGGEFKGVRTH